VRLDFTQFFAREQGQARHSVRSAALVQLVEQGNLTFVTRNNNLPAFVIADGIFVAELPEKCTASQASARLGRTGLVVNPRVNDTAVVASLMMREAAFLLQHDHRHARMTAGNFVSCC
jgi:hypothetical protein